MNSLDRKKAIPILLGDTDRFLIGNTLELAQAGTKFSAAVNSCGIVNWNNAVVGDVLTSDNNSFTINGSGNTIGYCAENNSIILLPIPIATGIESLSPAFSAPITVAAGSSQTVFSRTGSGYVDELILSATANSNSTITLFGIRIIVDGAVVVDTSGLGGINLLPRQDSGVSNLPINAKYNTSITIELDLNNAHIFMVKHRV